MVEEKLTRKEQAEKTREILFNAAMELLDNEPFEQITVREIVKRAGVSIGSFYNYYSSKLDVYYETYIFADEYFEDTVKPLLEHIDGPKAKLLKFFEYYAGYSSEITNLSLTRILYNADNKCFDRNRDFGMFPLLKSIVEEGQKDGSFRTDMTSEEISRFLMVSTRGVVYDWCTHDGAYNLKEAVKKHVVLLCGAIDG